MDDSAAEIWNSDSATTPSISGSDKEVTIVLASSKPKRRAGRRKFQETRHPVYRVRRRNLNKLVCELREPNNKKKRIWLGTYPTAEMAARAHDVAALALLNGVQNVCLNFADSVWRLPVPLSSDAKDIRDAAVKAAEAFRPREEEEVEGVHEAVDQDYGVWDNENEEKREEVFERKISYLEVEVLDSRTIEEMEYELLYSPTPCFDVVGQNKFWLGDLESDVELSLWDFSF